MQRRDSAEFVDKENVFSAGEMGSVVDLTKAVSCELDGDLMIQIFHKLPVKSIIRFKAVCRSWYALFSSQNFIHHHCDIANSSVKKTQTLSLLVHVKMGTMLEDQYDEIFSLCLEQSDGNPSIESLTIPLKEQTEKFVLLGAINGLVCLNYAKSYSRYEKTYPSFMLWNPAIRKHFYVPDPPSAVKFSDDVSVVFAYDQITDSYKAIRIISHGRTPGYKIEIYNTRTNAWTTKEFEGICFFYKVHSEAVVINGVPYWLECDKGRRYYYNLVWFDPSTEDLKSFCVPRDDDGDADSYDDGDTDSDDDGDNDYYDNSDDDSGEVDYTSLMAMGENLAIVTGKCTLSRKHIRAKRVDITKLIKYDNGGESSYCIEKSRFPDGHDMEGFVGFGRNGEIIIQNRVDQTLHLCDQKGMKLKCLATDLDGHCHASDYIQSLVWPFI